jgi:Tfp pilus assembly protein PilO
MSESTMARILWALTFVVVAGIGVGCVWYPASQRIEALNAASHELYDEANSDELEVRRSQELRQVRERIVADVRKLSGQRSNATAMAAALHLLSDESKRFNVELRSVVPQPASATPAPLIPSELTLGLRGRFRNIVAMLVDLPRHDVLIGVRDVAFASTSTLHAGVPVLDVTIHATLYRVRDQKTVEDDRVASAP